MRKFFQFIGVVVVVGFLFTLLAGGLFSSVFKSKEHVSGNAIMKLELDGIIMDGKTFLKQLRKYREVPEIKGILVHVNSPGGVVGPSQEIYAELKRTKEVYKKPIVVSGSGLVASGAFYAAMAADKFVTNPGTLVGSIGVIMEFANLEKLYDWAKIKRFVIKTGAYKDTGAEYREMREDEKKFLQGLMDDVLLQFKKAIAEGRNLPMEKVTPYADGRIFTGEQAVALGFADQVGTYTDALEILGEMTKLGKNPEVFEPPREYDSIMEFITSNQEESRSENKAINIMTNQLKMMGQPLFMMKGTFGE
ncbi:MAG: signal peptide peptidase SppA [Bdellovibrionota bacterium]